MNSPNQEQKSEKTLQPLVHYVTKRDGTREDFDYEQITNRLNFLCFELNKNFVDVNIVVKKVYE